MTRGDGVDITGVSHERRARELSCSRTVHPLEDDERWSAALASALLAASERIEALLATASNLYGYGPVDSPITACESHVFCSKNSLASITSSVTHAYTSPNATAFL